MRRTRQANTEHPFIGGCSCSFACWAFANRSEQVRHCSPVRHVECAPPARGRFERIPKARFLTFLVSVGPAPDPSGCARRLPRPPGYRRSVMPSRPPRHVPAGSRSKRERGRQHDAARAREQPWRAWYKSAEWRQLRVLQLQRESTCRICTAAGRYTPATIVDHVERHRGDRRLFFSPANLASLCKRCHDSAKQSSERTGRPIRITGADGWPVDLP